MACREHDEIVGSAGERYIGRAADPSLRRAMPSLELKIPPPVLALLAALAMWALAKVTPVLALPWLLRTVPASVIVLAGIAMELSGGVSFRRAHTTVNPLKPGSASALVTSGIYRVTRNPMYVGLALVLLGWGVWLAAPLALLGPVLFVAWITRFQIIPEERVLTSLFGADYAAYRGRVRRWL
jgi:protein-S-isoprenylcysteine O-methyltransferase Ste14